MAPTTVLISGANRGLGKGLAARYLSQPDHTVIAANRDPEHTTSKALATLPKAPGSSLIIVKVDAVSNTDAFDAVKDLQDQGIDHLDIVIANSGIMEGFFMIRDITIDAFSRHMDTNLFGVVRLFQATLPLLQKSDNPKFISMGSATASIGKMLPFNLTMYATSKAAVHWMTKRINEEEEKITSFVLSPGWARSDMGNTAAMGYGLQQAPVPVQESCDGMFKVINNATKESSGGKFLNFSGKEEVW